MISELLAEAIAAQPRGAQARLAEKLSVTPQTVNKWVHGEVCPEPRRWRPIERALGLEAGTIARRSRFAVALVDKDGAEVDLAKQLEKASHDIRLLGMRDDRQDDRLDDHEARIRRLEDLLATEEPPTTSPAVLASRRRRAQQAAKQPTRMAADTGDTSDPIDVPKRNRPGPRTGQDDT